MIRHKRKSLGVLVGALFSTAMLLVPGNAMAQTSFPPGYDADPAHHSTDVNDPDPAHHRPVWVYSASTDEFRLVPIAGFDLAGNRLGSGGGGAGSPFVPVDNDPAHHSTDVNDPDPAHHQPTLECEDDGSECRYVPIRGFDLNGYPVEDDDDDVEASAFFS